MDNSTPIIKEKSLKSVQLEFIEDKITVVNAETVFELIRDIRDPEHPYTLEDLAVVSIQDVRVWHQEHTEGVLCTKGYPIKCIEVVFTPTVPHCSLVGIIGLCIAYQLYKHTKEHKIILKIKEDSHSQEDIYNKQLNDKERVLAAFENTSLVEIINDCINYNK